MSLGAPKIDGYWDAHANRLRGQDFGLFDQQNGDPKLYQVVVSGGTELGRIDVWLAGDYAYYNGHNWSKLLGAESSRVLLERLRQVEEVVSAATVPVLGAQGLVCSPKAPGIGQYSELSETTDRNTIFAQGGPQQGYGLVEDNALFGREVGARARGWEYNTVIGNASLQNTEEAENNVVIGNEIMPYAGATSAYYCERMGMTDVPSLVRWAEGAGDVSGNVVIGCGALFRAIVVRDSVVIGAEAGDGLGPTVDGVLALQTKGHAPLIAGWFPNEIAGVNVPPEEIAARWHIRSGNTLPQFPELMLENTVADTVEIALRGLNGERKLTFNTAEPAKLAPEATDNASVLALVNSIRAALLACGLAVAE